MTIEKFAWLPKKVYVMKGMNEDYRNSWVWLVWYWEDTYKDVDAYYMLSSNTDRRLVSRTYTRTTNNKW